MMAVKKKRSQRSRLATQIRISYLILLFPSIIFMIYAFTNILLINREYNNMVSSVVKASAFILDFKDNINEEVYYLVVGNKTPKNTTVNTQLDDAKKLVEELKSHANTTESSKYLSNTETYLKHLDTYIQNILNNLGSENKYDDNYRIWENDVQNNSELISEDLEKYIASESRQMQIRQTENQNQYIGMIEVAVGILIVSLVSMIVVSSLGPVRITRPIAEEVKEEQKKLRKAEFDLLQAQINPHFLYNTLDAIIWSAEAGKQKQVVNMVGNLSDFFRLSLNKGKEIVLVEEELNHVKSYLEIQKIRYQDIMNYEVDVPSSLFENKIPKLTVQPLVENALYHGIKNKRGGGTIEISGRESSYYFEISVKDNGIGMTEERLAAVRQAIKDGSNDRSVVYGLYNVNARIRLNFGDEYGIRVDSKYGEGSTVTIRLPKIST